MSGRRNCHKIGTLKNIKSSSTCKITGKQFTDRFGRCRRARKKCTFLRITKGRASLISLEESKAAAYRLREKRRIKKATRFSVHQFSTRKSYSTLRGETAAYTSLTV